MEARHDVDAALKDHEEAILDVHHGIRHRVATIIQCRLRARKAYMVFGAKQKDRDDHCATKIQGMQWMYKARLRIARVAHKVRLPPPLATFALAPPASLASSRDLYLLLPPPIPINRLSQVYHKMWDDAFSQVMDRY